MSKMGPPQGDDGITAQGFKTWLAAWWRYSLAIGLVVGFGVVGWAFGEYEPVCSDVADAGTVVETCRPLAVTDVPVIALIAVILLLLWPDLSELSFGSVSLKREIEKQGEATRRAVEMQVASVARAAAMANLNLTISNSETMSPEDVAQVADHVREELHPETDESVAAAAEDEADRIGLVTLWLQVQRVLSWASSVHVSEAGEPTLVPNDLAARPGKPVTEIHGMSFTDPKAEELARFVTGLTRTHEPLLRAARSARNMVVHGDDDQLDDDTVIVLTRSLERYLRTVQVVATHLGTSDPSEHERPDRRAEREALRALEDHYVGRIESILRASDLHDGIRGVESTQRLDRPVGFGDLTVSWLDPARRLLIDVTVLLSGGPMGSGRIDHAASSLLRTEPEPVAKAALLVYVATERADPHRYQRFRDFAVRRSEGLRGVSVLFWDGEPESIVATVQSIVEAGEWVG